MTPRLPADPPDTSPCTPGITHRPTVLITGGSGFIGARLAADFQQRGWRVLIITRRPDDTRQRLGDQHDYISLLSQLDPSIWVDLVINLAGASVGQGRWTAQRRQTLLDSRLNITRELGQWLRTVSYKPQRLIQASAVGYYGIGSHNGWSSACDENAPPQPIFLSELCQQWEAIARSIPADSGVPVSICRLGVVLGHGGGILPQLLKPVSMGVGRIGSGQQPLPWIHIDDVVGAIRFLSEHSDQPDAAHAAGPGQTARTEPLTVCNLVAPETTTQLAFARTAARLMQRRLWLSVPAPLMRLAMGEQADLVLDGQFVRPARLLADGYRFRYPTLDEALRNLMAH